MRGSEFYRHKQLFPGYRQVGLSRYSARLKFYNEQKHSKLSENSVGSYANGCIIKRIHCLLESVSYEGANGIERRHIDCGKNQHGQS